MSKAMVDAEAEWRDRVLVELGRGNRRLEAIEAGINRIHRLLFWILVGGPVVILLAVGLFALVGYSVKLQGR